MKYFVYFSLAILILLFFGCNEYYDQYYNSVPETSDTNVWYGLAEDTSLSVFTNLLIENHYDDLIKNSENCFTVFAPVNSAMKAMMDTSAVDSSILNFHISDFFIQTAFISGTEKVVTLGSKYANIERIGGAIKYEGIPVEFESPLYRNGRFFKIDGVAVPLPNIYEYISLTMPSLKKYIDRKDIKVMDRALSRPIGFNEAGYTIYDTVSDIVNLVEEKYFPIKHELRFQRATLVFPNQEVYNNALNIMADDLGGNFKDYNDIPYGWQEDFLIPHLLKNGIFEFSREEYEFDKNGKDYLTLNNILGASIDIYYTPVNKVVCSNGNIYSYSDYIIPEQLYTWSSRLEMESLLVWSEEFKKFVWNAKLVNIDSDIEVEPEIIPFGDGLKDSLVEIRLPQKTDWMGNLIPYDGKFILDFSSVILFPGKYMMVVRNYYNIGGVYDVYVNDELVRTIDYTDYQKYRGIYFSVTGERVNRIDEYNIFDCFVDIKQYGKATIRLDYRNGGSGIPLPGFSIDYIEFIPEEIFEGYENYKF
ncbi:MAG: fasciclin domain-containing protein [Prolixibacteraceae bacterium]|nr:fasciclin domain-containing protein [Prolixibacteraceae bacterium]